MNKNNLITKNNIGYLVGVLGALILAATLKVWLVNRDVLPFNSDEAVVALMARHILQGSSPTFFYGQAYMGSLDAWLVAFGFWILGEHVWVIRLVQGILYLGVLVTTYKLGEVALGSKRVGLGAAFLLAVPNVIVTLYTTVSLGGYGEGLLVGNLILLIGLQISNDIERNRPVEVWRFLVWGILGGLGIWIFGITLIYSLSMGIFLFARLWQRDPGMRNYILSDRNWNPLDLIFIGGFIGATPWWYYGFKNGIGNLLGELTGSAVAVETTSWIQRTIDHFVNLVLFGGTAAFGLRPSWEIRWLALPMMPFVLAFWFAVVIYIVVRLRSGSPKRFNAGVLAGTMIILVGGFVFTSYGIDPSGRYFVPLVIPLCLFASEMIFSLTKKIGGWAWVLVPVIMGYNFWGIAQSADSFPPGITTQIDQVAQVDHSYLDELVQFLHDHDETYGYSNYWVSYPLAFHSNEYLIFIPRLPYHQDFRYTSRDDRYRPYTEAVESSEKVAYITTNNPDLDQALRDGFTVQDASWEEEQIGDYLVFYNLSTTIRPETILSDAAEPLR
jgi:hypothetical protein